MKVAEPEEEEQPEGTPNMATPGASQARLADQGLQAKSKDGLQNYSSTTFINKHILKGKAVAVPADDKTKKRSASNPRAYVADAGEAALLSEE